jgi:hypothetical protein
VQEVVLSMQCKDVWRKLSVGACIAEHQKTEGVIDAKEGRLHLFVLVTDAVSDETRAQVEGIGNGKDMPVLLFMTAAECGAMFGPRVAAWLARAEPAAAAADAEAETETGAAAGPAAAKADAALSAKAAAKRRAGGLRQRK